jgi:hypothetical protein
MPFPHVSRRRAILALLAGAGGAGVILSRLRLGPVDAADVDAALTLADRRAWHELGRRYLAAFPSDRDTGAWIREMVSGTDDDVVEAIGEAVDRDFRRGEIVLVEGWILARTEARLAALAAIMAGETASGRPSG